MVLSQLSKQTNLRENRLRCIRTHLEAFDIEPVLQISLFEEVIMEVEGSCNVKCSCKVETDRLFACQFALAYTQKKWPTTLKHNARLFEKIERSVGICIDRHKFEQFSRLHVNSDKILDSTVGIDLRPNSFNNIKDISNYFLFNTLGNRIYSFCQNQDCILLAIIGVNEKELYSNRLENFLFDYAKNDESRMMRV